MSGQSRHSTNTSLSIIRGLVRAIGRIADGRPEVMPPVEVPHETHRAVLQIVSWLPNPRPVSECHDKSIKIRHVYDLTRPEAGNVCHDECKSESMSVFHDLENPRYLTRDLMSHKFRRQPAESPV